MENIFKVGMYTSFFPFSFLMAGIETEIMLLERQQPHYSRKRPRRKPQKNE